jgi:hypothetical protein
MNDGESQHSTGGDTMIGIWRVSQDDALMKVIFDHLRNWVVSGAMLAGTAAAAARESKLPGTHYFVYGAACVMLILVLWLLLVNVVHVAGKLEAAGMSMLLRAVVMLPIGAAMGLVVISLINSQMTR